MGTVSTPMTIPDEAVQAIQETAVSKLGLMLTDEDASALATAALPFLQGVKVKALEWANEPEDNRIVATVMGGLYYIESGAVHCWRLEYPDCNVEFHMAIDEAKAAAQADYSARILSAIEPAPSSRAQALEEGVSHAVAMISEQLEKYHDFEGDTPQSSALRDISHHLQGTLIASAETALSSQPVADHSADAGKMVADGWLPIETAPKDGKQFLAYDRTNGYYNCAWHKNHHGEEYWMDAADTEPNPTHWHPLPASPGASE